MYPVTVQFSGMQRIVSGYDASAKYINWVGAH